MKLFTLTVFLLLCLIFRTYGSTSQEEKQRLNLDINHPVQILNDGWTLETDNQAASQKVSLPVVLNDEVNSSQFSFTFKCPDLYSDHSLRIRFLGLNGFAEINLNSVLIKEHPYFANSFYIDIPERLIKRNEDNYLLINLRRAKLRHEEVPAMALLLKEKNNFGILNEIVLEWLPPIDFAFEKYNYQNDSLYYYYLYNNRNVDNIKNKNVLIKIEEEIISPDGDVIFSRYQYIKAGKKSTNFKRSIKIGSQLSWSPDNPRMLRLILRAKDASGVLVESDYKMGLRSIQARKGDLYLNEQPLIVKGVTYRLPPPTAARGQMEQDLMTIKEMGFNTIRCPHYIPHPSLTTLADSLGILVFIETGIWRLPEIYYQDNIFLQSIEIIIKEILEQYQHNPSVTAVGLGHEISLASPEANKFIFIINEQFKTYPGILTYLSPLNPDNLPRQALTDFYMINKYGNAVLTYLEKTAYQTSTISEYPLLLGNIGFAWNNDKDQNNFYNYFFSIYASNDHLNGYFIESYRDWQPEISGPFTEEFEGESIYPFGIYQRNNHPRPLRETLPHLLKGSHYQSTTYSLNNKSSNFFSILSFISSIIFLLIYKWSFRFKENLTRSLVRPYGFFVDLRDRRIISTLNSTILGVFASLQMANFVGAYLFYYHDSLWFQEYLLTLTLMFKINASYLSIIQKPWYIVFALLMFFYSVHLLIAILIKVYSFFHREHIRFKQGLAVSNWSGSHAVFFIPLSMFGYYLFQQNILAMILWPVFIIFYIWYNFRLANGIRVLFVFRPLKIIIVMILTYVVIIVTLFVYAETPIELYDYFKLLGDADGLFY